MAILLGTAAALLAGEGVVRLLDLENRYIEALVPVQAADVAVHEEDPHPDLLYRLKPGAVIIEKPRNDGSPFLNRTIRISDSGYRQPDFPLQRRPGTFRIAALGGSNTYGAMVSDEETWPAELRRVLTERGHQGVEVFNLGVSGYEWIQKMRQAQEHFARLQPDLWIIQLGNEGPRHLLLGTDVVSRVREQPSLLDGFVPELPPGQGRALLEGLSRLWSVSQFFLVLHKRGLDLEMIASWTTGTRRAVTAEVQLIGTPRRSRRGKAIFEEFLSGPGGQVPILFLDTPTSTVQWQLDLAGERLFRMDQHYDTAPNIEATQTIHPAADGYTWYANELADELTRRGLLPSSVGVER